MLSTCVWFFSSSIGEQFTVHFSTLNATIQLEPDCLVPQGKGSWIHALTFCSERSMMQSLLTRVSQATAPVRVVRVVRV